KAHRDLIVAFAELSLKHRDLNCKLVIVGDGPERASLESAARASGLDDKIIFTGQVAEVSPFYAIADVFVLPSHSEGSPNVLLEAMTARVPVVATAVGGVPEIVKDNESALLVPAGNPVKLAAAIERVLSDDKLAARLADNAAVLVEKNHSVAQYVRNVSGVYRDAIEQR